MIAALVGLSLIIACAKEPVRYTEEVPRKIGVDPTAEIYLDFIRSEIERYDDQPEKSLSSIDEAIAANPGVGYFYYQRAIIKAGEGDWESVIRDCRETLRRDPSNLDAKILLGQALGITDHHAEAIRYFEEVRKKDPKRQDVYPFLAKEYMNVKKYRQAERVMLSLLARDSEAMVGYYYLGAIYGAYLKQPSRAIAIYQKILTREPDNVQVIDAISQLYLDSGKPEKALDMFVKLEKYRPNDVSLKLKIARLHYKLKNYPAAIQNFEEVLEKNPGSDKIIYYLGVLYEESGQIDNAIKMFETVPPVSGLYKDARLRLAYQYKARGEIAKAKSVLEVGIRKSPKIGEFYQYLAGIYEREGDNESAIRLLVRASKLFPNDEKLLFAIATLFERNGQRKKALEIMRDILEVNPKSVPAMNYIGYSYVEKGENLDEAEDLLQEAVHLKPDDGYIIDSLGWLYFTKGDYTRSFYLIKRALKLVPNEPTILKHMGQLYQQRGENKKAIAYYKKALQAWMKKEIVDKGEVQEVVTLIDEATNAE